MIALFNTNPSNMTSTKQESHPCEINYFNNFILREDDFPQNTNRIASKILDFPEPLGPTMLFIPLENLISLNE